MVVLNSRFALAMTVFPQFQKLRLVSCMFFNQDFEFCVQSFFTSLETQFFYTPRPGSFNFDYAKLKETAQLPLLFT